MREIRPLLLLVVLFVLVAAWRFLEGAAGFGPGSRETGPPASLLVELPRAGEPVPSPVAAAGETPSGVAAGGSEWFLVVDRSRNELRVYREGEWVRSFPVATGYLPELTPAGRFPIVVKGIEPAWRDRREGRIVPGGSPENPLGSRWLGLGVPGTDGLFYGIHGTNQPGSIGRYVTLGCIRMHNADVEWLFDRVPEGTLVEVTGEIAAGG